MQPPGVRNRVPGWWSEGGVFGSRGGSGGLLTATQEFNILYFY